MSTRAFRPFPGGNVPGGPGAAQIIAVTTAAGARTALNLPSAQGGFDALFYNAGSGNAFLRFGDATVVATDTDFSFVVPAGALISYGSHGATHLAHRGSVAGTLYVMLGEGV